MASPPPQLGHATGCLIAFGSNLGDGPQLFSKALEWLQRDFDEIQASRLFRTRPIGPGNQPEYVNAAIRFTTTRPAADVLDRLLAIECGLGRRRSERWTARTVDLDLLLYGQAILPAGEASAEGGLAVPHPRLSFRQFVLQPACEIAGDWWHPVCRASLDELRMMLGERSNVVAVADPAIWEALWQPTASGERQELFDLPGGATVLRGPVGRELPTTGLQFELVLVDSPAAWSWLHSRAKLLVVRGSVDRAGPGGRPRWRGPLLTMPQQFGTEMLLREIGGALAAMSPESVLGAWPADNNG